MTVTPGTDDPEAMTPDGRTSSEHDCDRILYSDAFRRLGGVTQVIVVAETPLFHTRLTHTLKVAQLGRRIAQHLNRDPANAALMVAGGRIDESAVEAAGLAHDLGHPPFGHIAEQVLDGLCVTHGLDGFEGNAQTFRVLTKLARHKGMYGLGASDVTLGAVIKYPRLRTGAHAGASKWNAYPTEREHFERARAGRSHERQTVEASVMDWADDITYAVHDIEDFIRAGRIPIARVAADPDEFDAFAARALLRLRPKDPDLPWDDVRRRVQAVLRTWFAQFGTHRGSEESLTALRSASSGLIGTYVQAARLDAPGEPIVVDPLLRAEVDFLKQLIWHYVIHEPGLATMQEGQMRVVGELFAELLQWLERAVASDELHRLPTRLLDLWELTEAEPGANAYANPRARAARAVADYISSLTEAQAYDLHGRLRGAAGLSVLDPWLSY